MNYPLTKSERLTNAPLSVLLVILRLAEENQVITVDRIVEEMGWNSPHYAHQIIHDLKRRGLIDFEQGKGGTIRPKCFVRIFKEE